MQFHRPWVLVLLHLLVSTSSSTSSSTKWKSVRRPVGNDELPMCDSTASTLRFEASPTFIDDVLRIQYSKPTVHTLAMLSGGLEKLPMCDSTASTPAFEASPTFIDDVLRIQYSKPTVHTLAMLRGGLGIISCNEVIEARRGEGGKWTGLNGTVVSPNFPQQYPERLQCRVDFKAPPSYRVRIIFTDFLLHHPLNASNRNCDVVDSLSLFEGTHKGSRLAVFCGPGVPRPVMSSGSYLSLKFRSYTSGPHVKGYKAYYIFVNDFGLETGRQLVPNQCVFEFNATETASGDFYTPNPGGKYPRNTECHYVFLALPHQKVRLNFKFFDVEGIAPCSDRSDSDLVAFSSQPDSPPRSRRYCGRYAPKVVDSPGPYFRVIFRSNHKFDGLGFEASYSFMQRDGNSTCELYPQVAMAEAVKNRAPYGEATAFVTLILIVIISLFV